jgi:hypothetical protein
MAANAEITVTLKGDTAEVDAIVRNAMALLEENKTLRETLQGIANADWRKWDEESCFLPKAPLRYEQLHQLRLCRLLVLRLFLRLPPCHSPVTPNPSFQPTAFGGG